MEDHELALLHALKLEMSIIDEDLVVITPLMESEMVGTMICTDMGRLASQQMGGRAGTNLG